MGITIKFLPMKTKLRTLLLIGFSLILTVTLNAQTSKSCGQCHKAVSVYSKVGDYCPHCHVRWGYENTKTTTTSSYDYNDYPSYSTEEYTYTLSAYVSTNANLRSYASKNASVLCVVPMYSSIKVTGKSGVWYHVKYYEGFSYLPTTGYIHESLVNF
jgi:hypothetical protein